MTDVSKATTETLMQEWRVETDDVIGGFCVVVDRPGTPATGNDALFDFIDKNLAEHVVFLHNNWLFPA